jgi:predicted esterase
MSFAAHGRMAVVLSLASLWACACGSAGDSAAPQEDSDTGDGGAAGAAGSAGGSDAAAGALGSLGRDAAASTDASSKADAVETGGGLAPGVHTPLELGTDGAPNGYWEYLPSGYGDGTKRPLLVFWHGSGENGTDLGLIPNNGPPKLIEAGQWPASRPFIVLSPQHAGGGCVGDGEIHDFLTFAITKYSIDPGRVYLTGLSCGALGGAQYLKTYGGEQVVAAILIAGDASPMWDSRGCALLADVALWAFHGSADNIVSISGDNAAMPQFLACPMPRKDVRYTVYAGVGHDSWSRTYDLSGGKDIYTWLLGFSR